MHFSNVKPTSSFKTIRETCTSCKVCSFRPSSPLKRLTQKKSVYEISLQGFPVILVSHLGYFLLIASQQLSHKCCNGCHVSINGLSWAWPQGSSLRTGVKPAVSFDLCIIFLICNCKSYLFYTYVSSTENAFSAKRPSRGIALAASKQCKYWNALSPYRIEMQKQHLTESYFSNYLLKKK